VGLNQQARVDTTRERVGGELAQGTFNYSVGQRGLPVYTTEQKYNQIIPEIKSVDPSKVSRRDMYEIAEVSPEVAKTMKFDQPIEVSIFADGTMMLSDGHHRLAAAKQLGMSKIPAVVRSINAKGRDINALIAEQVSDQPVSTDTNYSIGTPQFKGWFGEWDVDPTTASKVIDSDGKPMVVYHGTQRPDRVGDRFRKSRATSGPMAYFTSDPAVGSSYATGKMDTSVEMPSDYAGWFKWKGKGMRSPVAIDRAWWNLSPEERAAVNERIYTIGYSDWDASEGPIVADSQSIMSRDSIDYELRQARGNGLRALVEMWLSSGSLFNQEERFLEVLQAAGVKGATLDDPNAARSAVYPVYLSIKNPLDTGSIPEDVVSALDQAGKRKRAKQSAGKNPDGWDKNTISGNDWMAALKEDIAKGTTYAWTRIPDWVTETLSSFGYDGIKDTGGKRGGMQHQVWIPFNETQVKSATGNRGTFDPTSANINYSIGKAADLASKNPELAKEIQKKSDALLNAAEQGNDVFFTKFWPQMLKKTGMNFKPTKANLLKAAETGMPEILEWLKSNPQYLDYYHKDWELTHDILKAVFPKMTDDDLTGFRIFTGITSPNTKLMHNMADAVQLFNLWMDKGSIKSMRWEWSAKGNRKVGGGPFTFSGTTGAGKTFTAHVLEDLHGKLGSWESVKNYLWEGVSIKELNAFNKEAGYKGTVDAGKIRQVVQSATGQSELIPRMFIFGPKVGAYTLNTSGDDRYTTTDIWEGRFIRSHFPAMFNDADGLPTSVEENKIFQEFAQAFNEVFKRESGLDLPPSALQAVRWFYMLNHAKKAGYKYASTDDTISGYTERAVRLKLGINPRPAGAGGTGSDQANNGALVQKGDTNYSIASQSEIDRVNRALGGMNRGPDERLKVYERARAKFGQLLESNKEAIDAIKSAKETDTAPALEQVETERASNLADLTAEENAEVAQALQDNADTFMPRIEAAATPAERKRVERDAKDRAKILEQGIRDKYKEQKKAIDTKANSQSQQIKESAANRDSASRARMTEKVRRTKLLQSIGELDAVLSVLPPEIRGKVGGFAVLANIGTGDKALSDFFVKRIEMIDRQLERTLRKEYDAAFRKLLDRTKPKKAAPGEKPKGIGADIQDLFTVVRSAVDMDAVSVAAHIAGLDAKIASGELTAEQEARAQVEAALVSLVGDWRNADADRRRSALTEATRIWSGAYAAHTQKVIQLREQREVARMGAIQDTGKSGELAGRKSKAIADSGLKGSWKDYILNLLNFDQVAGILFGENSETANTLIDRQRTTENAKEDGQQAKMQALEGFFTDLAGGNLLAGEQLRYNLAQPSMEVQGIKLSELEGLSAAMMWEQEDGRRHMTGELDETGKPSGSWHYDQDFVDDIIANLSPEALQLRDWLLKQYADEYGNINAVYSELNGVNLPQIRNYSPVTVQPVSAPTGQVLDPVSGSAMSGASTSPGALRTRGTAIAEPRFADVLQTYISHTLQMEHWKAFAPFIAEVNGVLRNRDVQNSVEEKGGAEARKILNAWLDYFAQGGTRDAGAHLALNQGISNVLGRVQQVALIGRASTLLVQSTQLGAALAEMPTKAYLKRMGKLFTGQLGWDAALNSPYIQRRIAQMPPVVQMAMQGLKGAKPTAIQQAGKRLGNLLSGADGLFTAGTYAITYDYHLTKAQELGLTGAEAESYARNIAERVTDRIAQPTRPGARSLYENTSTNPLARAGWAFASEARKNLALVAYSFAERDTATKMRTLAYVVVLNAIGSQILRSIWRDILDDEDDEIFDDKYWSPKRFLLAAATEPLYGFPVLGSTTQNAIYKAFGEYRPDGSMFDVGRAINPVKRIPEYLEGDFEMRDVMRDIDMIVSAMGLAHPNIAAAASITHLAKDLFNIGDSAVDAVTEE
jgi:hypothetical protein